tara:strand:+ start:928 stop:1344 length:417 start_codon:yes stop_codon:yes gene_type:complete
MKYFQYKFLVKSYSIILLTSVLFNFSCEDNYETGRDNGNVIDGSYVVYAGNMYYSPKSITISQGDSITFVNEGGFHDVYTTSGPVELFLNPCNAPCTIGTLVFEEPGTYDYICSIGSHAEQGMIGTIIVNTTEQSDDY